MVKPIPKSSDPAPLKLDYRSIVSTETLKPRCKTFLVSTDVMNIISLPCSKQSIKIRLALKKFICLGGFPGALSYLALTRLVCATEHDNQVFRNLSSEFRVHTFSTKSLVSFYTGSLQKSVNLGDEQSAFPLQQSFSKTKLFHDVSLLMVEPLGHSLEA